MNDVKIVNIKLNLVINKVSKTEMTREIDINLIDSLNDEHLITKMLN